MIFLLAIAGLIVGAVRHATSAPDSRRERTATLTMSGSAVAAIAAALLAIWVHTPATQEPERFDLVPYADGSYVHNDGWWLSFLADRDGDGFGESENVEKRSAAVRFAPDATPFYEVTRTDYSSPALVPWPLNSTYEHKLSAPADTVTETR